MHPVIQIYNATTATVLFNIDLDIHSAGGSFTKDVSGEIFIGPLSVNDVLEFKNKKSSMQIHLH